jgi:glucokinase
MNRLFVGVDVGKTNIRVGITEEDPLLKHFNKQPYSCSLPEELVACISRAIEKALASIQLDKSNLSGIGIGVPGVVDRSSGKVLFGPDFDYMYGHSLTDSLRSYFEVPVVADIDPIMATWGENWAGTGCDSRNFAVITWGTGIGAGLVLHGEVLELADNLFPEFGHSIVSDDDWPCICGARGCLNALASGPGIAKHGQIALVKGKRTLIDELAKSNSGKVTSRMVFEAADKGDEVAQQILKRVGILLGRLCVNIVYTVQPEKIVIVGGLAEKKKWVFETIQETLKSNCWLIFRGLTNCTVVFSILGDTAGVLGAIRKVQLKIENG